MKKKAFITIYVLLLLLILSITVAFIYDQNQNDADFNKDLYDKKQALYISESLANLAVKDEKFEEYKNKVSDNIKNYYYDLIIRKALVNKKNKKETDKKIIQISYDSKDYRIKLIHQRKIENKEEIIKLETMASKGETRAHTRVKYRVIPIFEFYKQEPIIYNFKEDLNFEKISLKEDPPYIDLEEEFPEERFYKFNSDLSIENLTEEEFTSYEEDTIDDLQETDKDNPEEKEEVENKEQETEDKPISYKGILYIKGDLILETDFYIDGLLILDGNIISKSDKNQEKAKVKIKGQLITKSEIDKEVLDYTYDKHSYMHIKQIDNLFKTEIFNKKVY